MYLLQRKEMIFIVTKSKGKNDIMKAIMEKAGMDSKAKSIVFSLPVRVRGVASAEEDTFGKKYEIASYFRRWPGNIKGIRGRSQLARNRFINLPSSRPRDGIHG